MITIVNNFTSDSRWFNDLCESFKSVDRSGTRIEDTALILSPELGNGKINFMEVVEGLGVLSVDYTFKRDIHWVNNPSPINDYFMINFNIGEKMSIKTSDNIQTYLGSTLSGSVFYSSSGTGFELLIPKNKRIRFVQLIISNKWILNKIHYYKLPLSKNFQNYEINSPFQKIYNLNLDCKRFAENISEINFSDSFAWLEIKADALALISCFYSKVNHVIEEYKKVIVDDVERIKREVADMITSVNQWPAISYVAWKCGMSKTKFSGIFFKIYNKTFQDFCLESKIVASCKLIISGNSIADAGYHAGYASLGHFSKMFRKTTGMLPSQVKKLNKVYCKLSCRDCPWNN